MGQKRFATSASTDEASTFSDCVTRAPLPAVTVSEFLELALRGDVAVAAAVGTLGLPAAEVGAETDFFDDTLPVHG